jgi:hypothetical protein
MGELTVNERMILNCILDTKQQGEDWRSDDAFYLGGSRL